VNEQKESFFVWHLTIKHCFLCRGDFKLRGQWGKYGGFHSDPYKDVPYDVRSSIRLPHPAGKKDGGIWFKIQEQYQDSGEAFPLVQLLLNPGQVNMVAVLSFVHLNCLMHYL